MLHARCKTSTGIVGLPVQPEAKAILEGLYTKTLSALEVRALPRISEISRHVAPSSLVISPRPRSDTSAHCTRAAAPPHSGATHLYPLPARAGDCSTPAP